MKKLAFMISLGAIFTWSSMVYADGETTVTLGEDVSLADKETLLEEMNAPEEAEIVYVANEREHEYLGDYMDASDIGTNALSSARITATEEGSGLDVTTNNITMVTETMYANALATAGIQDAEVYITAPFPVSGTAALTGLIKAYETQNDIVIDEDQQQVANEEVVRAAELGEDIGEEEATAFMDRIKEELANSDINSREDMRDLISRVAEELDIDLSEERLEQLTDLFYRMSTIDIDWDHVGNQLQQARETVTDFFEDEETQSVMASIQQFFQDAVKQIRNWFS